MDLIVLLCIPDPISQFSALLDVAEAPSLFAVAEEPLVSIRLRERSNTRSFFSWPPVARSEGFGPGANAIERTM